MRLLRVLPNLLSAARLLAAPLIGRFLWTREYEWALGLFVLAGISDGLDGLLARWWKASSRLGAYLDPIADKLLLTVVYVVLAVDTVIARWLAALVVGRDLLILALAGAGFFLTSIRDFPPSLWGKVSTVLQILYIVVVLFNRSILAYENIPGPVEAALFWGVAAGTIWSGLHYTWVGWSRWRHTS